MNHFKLSAIFLQFILSFLAFERVLWKYAELVKRVYLPTQYDGLFSWAYLFYHPFQGTLLNYAIFCVSMAVVGILIYSFFPGVDRFKLYAEKVDSQRIVIFLALTVLCVMLAAATASSLVLFPVVILPLLYRADFSRFGKVFPAATVVLLSVLCFEPLRVMFGPVRLVNEYSALSGITLLPSGQVGNEEFLEAVSGLNTHGAEEIYSFIRNADSQPPVNFSTELIWRMSRQEAVSFDNLLSQAEPSPAGSEGTATLHGDGRKRLLSLLPDIREFYKANLVGYFHQNVARGQINHIGHVLNPLNEYVSGKPLKDVFMQYGLGNTLLLKWTMDLFGGVSIQNFYKCYAFYLVYFIFFLLMLWYVFKDALYVFASMCGLAAAHFFYSYIAFIVAPGIIPTIHLFDVVAAVALMVYLNGRNKGAGMLLVAFAALAALVLNPTFGFVLLIALSVSIGLHLFENTSGKKRNLRFVLFIASVLAVAYVPVLLSAKSSPGVFKLYLTGFFSWKPSNLIVALTMVFFALSYLFVASLKLNRSPWKYFYVFVFLYVQGLLGYFYWSGLINHLPMAVPFLVFQFFLTLYIYEKHIPGLSSEGMSLLRSVKGVAVIAVAASALLMLSRFYNGNDSKYWFDNYFREHKTYRWDFSRANLLSTADPAPIKDAVRMIEKHSDNAEGGIYILSKMDNLLPFLAGKHSRLPYSDLAWYMANSETRDEVIDQLRTEKPDKLFVDSDIKEKFRDPWVAVYNSENFTHERLSRAGRAEQFGKVFSSVSSDYRLLEKGRLISVYKRIR